MMKDGGLKDIFRLHLPHFDFQPIEMFLLAAGVPDLNFCAEGIDGWIELKMTKAWAVTVRPAQVGWIERRLRHGGRVFIAVRRFRIDADELWIYPGADARRLADGGLRAVDPIGCCGGGPSVWNWLGIESLLLGQVPDVI